MENKEMSQEKIESPDEKLIQHSESKKAMNGFQGSIVLLTVGNISGILINFVGAVFIRMYTHNVEAAVKFHAKFAESNNLLLANSIANKIEDEKLREETLSEIAKDIIVYNNTISD